MSAQQNEHQTQSKSNKLILYTAANPAFVYAQDAARDDVTKAQIVQNTNGRLKGNRITNLEMKSKGINMKIDRMVHKGLPSKLLGATTFSPVWSDNI